MKIEFDGAISLETPTEDELANLYDTIKARMQKDETFELMEELKRILTAWQPRRDCRKLLMVGIWLIRSRGLSARHIVMAM